MVCRLGMARIDFERAIISQQRLIEVLPLFKEMAKPEPCLNQVRLY